MGLARCPFHEAQIAEGYMDVTLSHQCWNDHRLFASEYIELEKGKINVHSNLLPKENA